MEKSWAPSVMVERGRLWSKRTSRLIQALIKKDKDFGSKKLDGFFKSFVVDWFSRFLERTNSYKLSISSSI